MVKAVLILGIVLTILSVKSCQWMIGTTEENKVEVNSTIKTEEAKKIFKDKYNPLLSYRYETIYVDRYYPSAIFPLYSYTRDTIVTNILSKKIE